MLKVIVEARRSRSFLACSFNVSFRASVTLYLFETCSILAIFSWMTSKMEPVLVLPFAIVI